MRTLIRELPYERLVAAGRHRYESNGRPTGGLEQWRLNSAVDGYCFLRVDRDDRDTASGQSALFHLTIAANGRPERLAFRLWDPARRVDGNILFEGTTATLAFTLNGDRHEMTVETVAEPLFIFPAALGHFLLSGSTAGPVTLLTFSDTRLELTAQPAEVISGELEESTIARRAHRGRTQRFATPAEERRVWFDENGIPLVVTWASGVTAVADQYIRHT